MGLDQYLYRVKDVDKFKELFKSMNDLDNELDRRYEELLDKFKEKHVNDIYMFKEKIVELSPDLKGDDIDRFGDKLFELIRSELDPKCKNMREDGIELLLFNISPLIYTFGLDEDKESLLRKKVVSNVISLLENIVKKLNKEERESIIEFESKVSKFDELNDEFDNNLERISYWRKANMIHGWFLKNVDWVEENVRTKVFKGSVLDKLTTDLEIVVNLIEDNYDINNDLIIKKEDPIYNKIVELIPPTSGYFFGSTDIDSGYYKIIKSVLTNLKDKYNPDDNYYYHASW